MSNYLTGETADLFDPITGAWVGVLDKRGNEQFVSLPGAVLSLAAGSQVLAAANTAAINAALALKGSVSITTPGNYYINGSLVVYEDTYFRVGPGVNIIRADNTLAAMLVCAYQASTQIVISSVQAVAVVGTAHAYLATATFAPPHGLSVGQYVQIWGDTTRIYEGVWKITSVPSPTTLTFAMGRGSIGTPPLDYTTSLPAGAGSMTGNPAVGNFRLDCDGAFDGNGNNGNAGSGWVNYGIYVNKIGHSRIKARVINCYYHNFSSANDWNLNIEDCYFDAYGVAIQSYGPSRYLKIQNNYTENTGDDGFAFLTQDTATFPAVPPASHNINGDIIGLTVSRNKFNRVDGSGCITWYNNPSNGWNFDGILCEDNECLGSAPTMFAINGKWGSQVIRGVRYRGQQMNGTTKVGGVGCVVQMNGSQGYAMTGSVLEVSDVKQVEALGPAQGFAGQATRLIDMTNQTAGTLIDRAEFRDFDCYFDATAYNSSTGYYGLLSDANTTINSLTMSGMRFKTNLTSGAVVPVTVLGPGGMTINEANLRDWILAGSGLSGIQPSFANTPVFSISGITVNGANNFIGGGNFSAILNMRDIKQISATQGFFNFFGNGSSGTITLNVSGASITGTVFANTPTSNTALKFSNADGSLPIDATKATFNSGALFYNSNAAYGAGVGLYAMGASATTRLAA